MSSLARAHLAFHLVSEHGDHLAIAGTLARNTLQHEVDHLIPDPAHRHSHSPSDLTWDAERLERTLEWAEAAHEWHASDDLSHLQRL